MMARIVALLTGTVALAALRGQFDALPDPISHAPIGQKLWFLAGYFTILTNLGVAGLMFGFARGGQLGAAVEAAMAVSIVMTGIIYHLLLARLWSPQGAAWWADQGLHTAVPLGVSFWWLAFADKGVWWRDLPKALVWPAIYCGYALVRGYLTGFWAYPFLNGDTSSVARIGLNIAALLLAFATLAAGLIWLAGLLRKPVLVE